MSKARIEPVKPGTRPELAAVEASISKSRGNKVSLLYQFLMNSPEIAQGWESLLTAVRQKASLASVLREMVILRVAILNGAPYEFEAHAPIALAQGLPAAAIDQLRTLKPASEMTELSEAQRQVLAYADAMTRDIEVPDAIYDAVAAQLDAQGVVELTATVGAYNMVSRFLVALRVSH